jgi:hypothetical protein
MVPIVSPMSIPMAVMTTIVLTINATPTIPGRYCFIIIQMFVYKYKDAYSFRLGIP